MKASYLRFTKPSLYATSILAMTALVGCSANDEPQGTDIYLADLSQAAHQQYAIDNIQLVTERKGYDNQPFFLPDGSGLLYTAMLPTEEGGYQTDSFLYDFVTAKHTNLTNSALSEYSPTLMAKGEAFSAVVVEEDNKQRLWAYPFKSEQSVTRIEDVEPVGYHAWGQQGDLTMFVLGEPSTLQFKDGETGKVSVVDKDIGRSLRYVAQRNSFSFTVLKSDGLWWLSEFDAESLAVTNLVPMPEEASYYTWLDESTAVIAVGNKLKTWHYAQTPTQTRKDWNDWVDVSSTCKTVVSRLAVNQQSSKLAFVCDE